MKVSDQLHTLITLLPVTVIKAEKKLGQIYDRRECPIQSQTSLLLYLYLQNIYLYLFYNLMGTYWQKSNWPSRQESLPSYHILCWLKHERLLIQFKQIPTGILA